MALCIDRTLNAILAASAVMVFATIVSADPTPAPGKPTTKPKSVYEVNPVLPDLKFDGVALTDVIEYMRDVSRANIFVDGRRIEAAKIDFNTAITLHLEKVSFRKALQSILAQVGTDANRLTFAPDGDVIVISTPAGLKAIADSAKALAAANASPALRAKLDRRLPDLKFDGVGLSDVVEYIQDLTHLSIEVDWKGLADAGVSRDVPLTARFTDVPTGQALRLLVDGIDSKEPIGISVREDKVIIVPVPAKK